MSELQEINEDSDCYLSIEFYDQVHAAVIPESMTYTITDVYSGTVKKTATTVTPDAASYTLWIPYTLNSIVNDTLPRERRSVIISFKYSGGAKQGKNEYEYEVINLSQTE